MRVNTTSKIQDPVVRVRALWIMGQQDNPGIHQVSRSLSIVEAENRTEEEEKHSLFHFARCSIYLTLCTEEILNSELACHVLICFIVHLPLFMAVVIHFSGDDLRLLPSRCRFPETFLHFLSAHHHNHAY